MSDQLTALQHVAMELGAQGFKGEKLWIEAAKRMQTLVDALKASHAPEIEAAFYPILRELPAAHADCVRFEREGVGDNTDIEAVDHRCGLCRSADEWLAKRRLEQT